MTTRRAAGNKGLNAMGAEVVNSTFVLLLSFCGLLNICASNPPTASSAKPLYESGALNFFSFFC